MTYALTAAHGAKVKIGNGASTEVFNEIMGVHNGPTGLGWVPNMIEARHHGSSNTFRKVANVVEQPLSFDLFYDSTETTTHGALLTAAQNKTRKNFKLELTDSGAEIYQFYAYVSMTLSAQVDGFNVYSVKLEVDGAIQTS